jgi:hypothetical protein
MKMKKTVLMLLLANCAFIKGQNYYAGTNYSNHHDVFPDSLMNYVAYPFTNETYSLDVFGSSAPDVYFTARGSVSSGGSQAYISIKSMQPDVYIRFGRWDSVWVPGSSSWRVSKVAKPLSSGDVINAPGAIWDNGELFLTNNSGSQGGNVSINDFVGGDKYIGLKYVEKDYNYNDVNHYGWIWVRCTTEDSCYVKEYSSTFKVIAGLMKESREKIGLYPNPSGNKFYLSNTGTLPFEKESLKVLDLLGKEVACLVNTAGDDLQVVLPSDTPRGCYFVQFSADGQLQTRKLMKTIE